MPPEVSRWLLLIHQLPTKPAYLRVKVWRRLQTLGAVSVKNTVYVLPVGEQAQEDFEWLLKEISEGGGEGMICEARLIDGLSDDDVRDLFNVARSADYDAVARDARSFEAALRDGAVPVRADITGARELTLAVEFGRGGDVQDHVDWVDARLIK